MLIIHVSYMVVQEILNAFTNKPLTSPNNYKEWKKNVTFVLKAEKHIYILITDYPKAPNEESTPTQRAEQEKLTDSISIAYLYIFSTTSDPLVTQHDSMTHARTI